MKDINCYQTEKELTLLREKSLFLEHSSIPQELNHLKIIMEISFRMINQNKEERSHQVRIASTK